MFEGGGLGPENDANTLARVLARSASLVQCGGCGVFIWDEDRHTLSAMVPFVGLDDDAVKNLAFPMGGTRLGNAALHDRSVVLDELGDGPADESSLKALGVQNGLAVPLAVERRNEQNEVNERSVFGLLCAFNKYYGRTFDQEDARLLSIMARSVSAVLVTSNLYWKAIERGKQLLSTMESMSVGVITISPTGTVTQLNARARQALGVDAQGWFGRSFEEIIPNAEIRAIIAADLAGDPQQNGAEIRLQHGADEERIYRVQSDTIVAQEGQSLGWVVVLEDVTDIRQAEHLMAAMVDMASHELRTPLTSIRGFVSTILTAGEGAFDWETQSEFLEIVDTEAERLGQLIDDLLNIARIKGGRGLQFNFTPTDLSAVINKVVRLQSSYVKGHEIQVDLDGITPVRCDEGKVQQVVNNLLGNAIKYSPNGGIITIRGREEDGGVKVSVADQGMGIPPEQLPRMFAQFFRVEGRHMSGIKGTGLGLWLTKHLIEGHGGKIWVESDFGKGSEFFFWLPRDPNEHSEEPAGTMKLS